MIQDNYDVIVVGGGPAGMIAAGTAAGQKRSVLLLERNNVLGVKLRITGNGRCNLTNKVSLDNFEDYYPDNPRFLYNAFNAFFNNDLIEFFQKLGLKTKVGPGNRVFPVTDKAGDVVKALELYLKQKRVSIRCKALVTDLIINDHRVQGVKLDNKQEVLAPKVIIATGGKSYPQLGSNGSAFVWAKRSGHQVVEARPGLCGICMKQKWVKDLQGISLTQADVSVFLNARKKKQIKSDMVFSHYGICGPAAFDLSADAGDLLAKGEVDIIIDLLPELSQVQALELLDRIIAKNPKNFSKNMDIYNIPQKLIAVCLYLAGINDDKQLGRLSKNEKRHLINMFKQVKLTVLQLRPLKEAMVTRGGVSVKQIDPKTMQSKLVKGLYFCGECIDVSGLSGGFNLQAAFSTGYAAGSGTKD